MSLVFPHNHQVLLFLTDFLKYIKIHQICRVPPIRFICIFIIFFMFFITKFRLLIQVRRDISLKSVLKFGFEVGFSRFLNLIVICFGAGYLPFCQILFDVSLALRLPDLKIDLFELFKCEILLLSARMLCESLES